MKDLTTGKPTKTILFLTLPMFISVIFQQMYNMADSIIAGQFAGEDALAAIGASYPITMIFMAVAIGCNIGCAIVISRLYGEKNLEEMKCCISTTIISCLVLSFLLTLLGYLTSSLMMKAIQTPQNIFSDGELYLNIYIFGIPFLFLYNVTTGIFTSLGDSRTPLYFLIGSSLGNIVLDYIFVAKLEWGVGGVAWATFIAQGVACVLAGARLYFVIKKVKTKPYKHFSFNMLSKISTMAIPSILQQSFISIGNILIQGVINGYGSSIIAGYSAAMKLNVFATSSMVNLGNGISTFISQNYGGSRFDRIKKGYRSGIKIVLVLAVPFFAVYFMFPSSLINIFLKEPTTQAIETGRQMLEIIAPFYFFIAVKIMSDGALRGMGNVKAFMIATFTDLIIRVILSFVLSVPYGIHGVYWSWPIGWVIGTVVSIIFWLKEEKKMPQSVKAV